MTFDILLGRIVTCKLEGQIMLTVQTQDILLKISECVNLIRRITLADCLIPPPRVIEIQ